MNNNLKFYHFVLGFVVVGKTIKMISIIHDPFICKFGIHVVGKSSWKNEKLENWKLENLKLEIFQIEKYRSKLESFQCSMK